MIEEILKVFKRLKETSSRTDKEFILKENKDFQEFRTILNFLYNPYILTGIKAKKLKKFAHFTSDSILTFNTVFEAIDFILENNTGKDDDVKTIANFINQHEGEEHDFLQDLFTKDYKCGITATTINKVYGKGTIPKFDVMLAKKFEDEEKKVKGEFGVTLKLDGIRCVAMKENGYMKFFTRQGQQIEGLVEIEKEFSVYPDNMVYDGELLLIDNTGMSSDDLFRATQKVVRKDGEKKNVAFHMFDVLPLIEFKEGKSKRIYKDRRSVLDILLTNIQQMYIRTLPLLYWGKEKSKIFEILEEVVAEDKEGVMVSNGAGYYVTKRTDNLLKVKKMHTMDLLVLDVIEGTGKNKGKLGAITVDYKDYEVGVGSGFSDKQREQLWENPNDIIGRIVEIQYFEESKNEDGGISLRFPVFKRIRDDKSEPSLH